VASALAVIAELALLVEEALVEAEEEKGGKGRRNPCASGILGCDIDPQLKVVSVLAASPIILERKFILVSAPKYLCI
jgi:hypothetical protein